MLGGISKGEREREREGRERGGGGGWDRGNMKE